ncbi:solute carrier family 22 member 13-like isoform X3 [Pomacea canaliculata]|uniref:solute carrier family 22 member 13-like isoform X3 n=1 Tax=Pomacea canaliculata TaxID=400727 RepID=UPI000D73F477|nr:solute carrier family 22 member 13-like isoform X3 [Pomacea canaliculata]
MALEGGGDERADRDEAAGQDMVVARPASSLDVLIAQLGRRNRFQFLMLAMLATNYIPLVFNHVIMAFYGTSPTHLCHITSAAAPDNDTMQGHNDSRNITYNNMTVLAETPVGTCSSRLFLASGDNVTVTCQHGRDRWEYMAMYGEHTIVSEWDLVCERKSLGSLATTIYFCGVMLGGILFGHVADHVGRLPVMLGTLYTSVAVGVGLAFVPTYPIFAVLRFVQGVLMQGLQTSTYIAAMEMFVPRQRPAVGATMECTWGAAVMVLPGLARLLRNWRHLQLVISVPSALVVFYICVLPESLRWLVLNGRLDKAEALARHVAKVNKIPFPKDVWQLVEREAATAAASPRSRYNIWHLVRTPHLRRRSLVLFYLWLSISTGYYGLTFQVTSLPGNMYLNFFIGGLVEFIAYAASVLIMNRFGRKRPLLVYFFSAAACCISASAIPRRTTSSGVKLEDVSTALAITGRFFTAGLFSVIFVYTTELYPTVIRNIGMGTCTFWARLGGVIAPQINQLGTGSEVKVPVMFFGCMVLVGGGLLLLLPDTHNQQLPDTVQDVENSHYNETLHKQTSSSRFNEPSMSSEPQESDMDTHSIQQENITTKL